MSIIKVENLTKTYGNFIAVNHISFTVEKGTLFGFLGVNGAGKTTVINMLTTLLAPDEGTAEICGETLGKNNEAIRRKVGVVYQQNCLDDILTVEENLLCRGILHGATREKARTQCKKLSEILKLDEILKKKYRMLSGGQKRRCEIAAALMHTPEILFLDEPTTGVDPATRADVWKIIKELQKKEKMTVFLTTHYMEEAAGAENIIIMDRGTIVNSGTPFQLKERYATDKLRVYYNEENKEVLFSCFLLLGEQKNVVVIENGILEIEIPSTISSIPIIKAMEPYIQGFEVIQGNMDDVFLNALKREQKESRIRKDGN